MLGLRFDVLQRFGSFSGHRGFLGQQQGLTLFAQPVLLSLCVRGGEQNRRRKKNGTKDFSRVPFLSASSLDYASSPW